MKLHNLEQRDNSIFVYLQKAKSYSDALATAGQHLSLVDFNFYGF